MVHDLQQTLLLAKKHKFVMCNIVKIEIQKFKHSKVIKIMVTSLQKKRQQQQNIPTRVYRFYQ